MAISVGIYKKTLINPDLIHFLIPRLRSEAGVSHASKHTPSISMGRVPHEEIKREERTHFKDENAKTMIGKVIASMKYLTLNKKSLPN